MEADAGLRGVRVADGVLVRPVGDELVILSAATERYFGLDEVGTAMWQAMTASETLGAAADALVDTYDVRLDELAADVVALAGTLVDEGLLAFVDD